VDKSTEGVVLLIGSGRQPYREYLMAGASQRGDLWLIDAQEPTWQRSFSVGSSVVALLDEAREIPDRRRLIDTAVDIARAQQVLGAFTYDELLVVATAGIAQRLGLRGLSPAGADRCRDKHRSRQALTAAGLPQPRFALTRTPGEAVRAADVIGYPVVAKPLGMAASVGVARAESPGDLESAFAVAERASQFGPPGYAGGVLVEELIEGPEISIDGAVVAGEHFGFCLARKQSGFAPYFEEIGHIVDGGDPLLTDPSLRDVLRQAHRALRVRDGITHTEVRLSDRGPVVIEVNGRLGGDLIPYLGKLAVGVDPGQVAVDVAVGRTPRLEPSRRQSAGIRFLYPPEDCRVLDVCLPGPDAVPGLADAHAMASPGEIVRLPPRAHLGRYACVICVADDADCCAARLEDAVKLADLHYEPLDSAASADGRPW
jgi:biotin carboxylase